MTPTETAAQLAQVAQTGQITTGGALGLCLVLVVTLWRTLGASGERHRQERAVIQEAAAKLLRETVERYEKKIEAMAKRQGDTEDAHQKNRDEWFNSLKGLVREVTEELKPLQILLTELTIIMRQGK